MAQLSPRAGARGSRPPALLWVATKAPWPPVDGGRLLALETLRALRSAGAEVTLVAPGDPRSAAELAGACRPRLVVAAPRSRWRAWLEALVSGRPYPLVRHRLRAVAREVERSLREGGFDLVHAEQLQAFPAAAAAAAAAALPVVLRAQNVESDLWAFLADRPSPFAPVLRRQARGVASWEGRAVERAAAVVALSRGDARRLRELSGREEGIQRVPAPFPETLPAGPGPAPGEPALVALGSAGWPPNRDALGWLLAEIWPPIRAALPGARLHLFGPLPRRSPGEGVVCHPPPGDSREAFPRGSIHLVPLRIGSGVRMKILESWARGVPVVATPEAAAGLEAEGGRELLVAASPEGFVQAVCRLREEPALGAGLVAAGRRLLRERHDPRRVARRLLEVYRAAVGGAPPEAREP